MSSGVVKEGSIEAGRFGVLTVARLLDGSYSPFSISKIELNGTNRLVRNRECDAAYYVLQGNGRFSIEDADVEVGPGDLVFLPRGTVYRDSGQMTMLSVYCPPFDLAQVEYLD
jgi:mannose-6-phosphate isomerase-like protein (cupin superfamily)